MKQASDVALESRVSEIASRIAETTGFELVLAEIGRMSGRIVVRLTIDRPEGVSIDDCATFSRRVGAELDADDPIPGRYSLEVSSPGLDRRLVKEADFHRFDGKQARIALLAPLEGRRNFQGWIRGFEDGAIRLEIEGGAVVRLPLKSVDKARLVPEY